MPRRLSTAVAREFSCRGRCGTLLELGAIFCLYFANFLVGAEKCVLGHIGAVFPGFRMAAQGFRQGANVVWARSAANPQVVDAHRMCLAPKFGDFRTRTHERDRKSTRLNSSHVEISYAVFCLKKKKE